MNSINYLTHSKAFASAVDSYFIWCDSYNEKAIVKPYTLSGLCLHLGITRAELDFLGKNKITERIVEMARLRIESATEEQVLTSKLACNPSLGSLKYNFGWNDRGKAEGTSAEMVVRLEKGLDEYSG